MTAKAVILARGLGTRMRRGDRAATLDAQQSAVAETGMKAMIPIGRPFLDYVLHGVADAGCREVCLVIGPEHEAIREYYSKLETERIRVSFAVQKQALGTADAVLAAEGFAGDVPFLVLNADNYYPAAVLAALGACDHPALAGFDPATLIREGNISPERIAAFAIVESGPDGMLRRIIEKPSADGLQVDGRYVSMNCWLFTSEIFEACRGITPSPRGELELPLAVQYLVEKMGVPVRVIPAKAGVLDLSSRADIPVVAARLAGVTVIL